MASKLDSRQSVQRPLTSDTRNTLDQLSNSTGLRLDSILNLINDELTPPLRIRTDPSVSYRILIESNQITTLTSTDTVGSTVGHSRKKTAPPINGIIPSFSSNAYLTIPSTLVSGTGTITGTNITIENQTTSGQYGTPSFTIGTDGHYIKMVISIRSNGNIVLTFGNSASTISGATLPSSIADVFPIGFIVLQRTSSTVLASPVDSNIYQFSANTNTLSIDSSVNRIYKANHLLSVGDVLYYNSLTGYYEKARADVSNTSNVVGMVSKVIDTNNFELTTNGNVSGITSQTLTAGAKYYLSTTIAGQMVSSVPTVAGTQVVELGTAISSSSFMLSIKNNYTVGEISNFQSPNIRTQINLSGSSSITQTTIIKDVSGYDAGQLVGWVYLDAITDYRFYIDAKFVKLANGSFSLTSSSNGDTPPAGYSLNINSITGVISLTLPAIVGWNSGYVVYAINAPAVGTNFPLSINKSDVVSNYTEINSDLLDFPDLSLATGIGFDSTIRTTLIDSTNGKIYIGGDFNSYKGIPSPRLIRLNIADGSIDTTFAIGTGFDNSIETIALDSSGKVYVGGAFTTYKGSTANKIIKLNTDGSIDTTFATGTGFTAGVKTITLDSSGKLYVGGSFTAYNGSGANYITKLNTDGSVDTSFVVGSGFNSAVFAIALDSSGKVYVGGFFTTYKGSAANRIIKLNTDGSVDTTFATGTGFNGSVYAIALDSANGKLYAGGAFTTYKGSSSNYITKLNTDGSVDTSFVVGSGFNNFVFVITLDSSGKIYIGGEFGSYKSVSSIRLIKLNTDGSIDTTFATGTGFDSTVYAVTLDSSGKIYVGGFFTTYKDTSSPFMIRLNTDGSFDNFFVTAYGFNSIIYATALDFENKKLYIGGLFTNYKGSTANKIIRINIDGSIDTTFATGTGFGTGFYDAVYAIALDSSGKIYVGGNFTTYNGSTANYIIKLNTDGSVDTTFATGTGFNGSVNTITLDSSGKLYAGGGFTTYKGSSTNYITKLNTDGSVDTTFATGTGFNNNIRTIALDSSGKVYVGGAFTTYKGSAANRIIKLNTDGSVDTSLVTGTGFSSDVYTIILDSSSKLYVGGNFSTYNTSNSCNKLIKLNVDGSVDTSFVVGSGFDSYVLAIALDSANGKVYVGGNFTTYKSTTLSSRIIRLNTDGSVDTSFVVGSGFDNSVQSISSNFINEYIYVGGNFRSYKGIGSPFLTRIKTSLFYLLKSTDYFSTIIGNTTCKIKLPAISGTGKEYVIKSLLTSNTVTVNAYNGALIDSSSSKNLQPAEYVKTISSSTKWITDYNIPFSLPSNTGTANQLLSSSGSGASSWVSGINITSANISGLTASRAIQTDASKNLNSAGFSLPTVSGNNSQLLKSDGTGTSSWTSAIYSTTVTGTAIDASTGNSFIQNGSGTPRNINVTNLADGQTININVQGQSGDVINWNITQPAGDPALNAPKVGTTYSNTMTSVNSIYTIIRFGQNIFINSLHGFG